MHIIDSARYLLDSQSIKKEYVEELVRKIHDFRFPPYAAALRHPKKEEDRKTP